MRLEDMGHQKVHQGPQFHEAVLQGCSCQEQASLAAKRKMEWGEGWSAKHPPRVHLPSIPPFRTNLLSHKSRTSPSSPVKIEQWLPALWLEVLDVLSLIQYKITPVLAAEGLVVLQHQLVRCDTHMEGIGLGPALQYQEKVAESRVKRTNKKKTS